MNKIEAIILLWSTPAEIGSILEKVLFTLTFKVRLVINNYITSEVEYP